MLEQSFISNRPITFCVQSACSLFVTFNVPYKQFELDPDHANCY